MKDNRHALVYKSPDGSIHVRLYDEKNQLVKDDVLGPNDTVSDALGRMLQKTEHPQTAP